jgi:hypothetical protein
MEAKVITSVIEKIMTLKSHFCLTDCPKVSCPCSNAIHKYKKEYGLTSQERREVEEHMATR